MDFNILLTTKMQKRTSTSYYPQVLLEECKSKYFIKEKKIPKNIIDDVEFPQYLVKKILIERILMNKIKKY